MLFICGRLIGWPSEPEFGRKRKHRVQIPQVRAGNTRSHAVDGGHGNTRLSVYGWGNPQHAEDGPFMLHFIKVVLLSRFAHELRHVNKQNILTKLKNSNN